MKRLVVSLFTAVFFVALVIGCSHDPEPPPTADLLRHVPADTPYVFVTSRQLPDILREKLADYYAEQMAMQRASLIRIREPLDEAPQTDPMVERAIRALDVVDAVLAEFEGRTTAAQVRELGIEPVTRSVFYGIGVLPAMRIEIADAQKLNAMLDRVEQRADLSVEHAILNEQAYRRFDLGQLDLVLSVDNKYIIAGLLPDTLFERELPMLLGQADPTSSMADSGDIQSLIGRYGFTGYGEGFIELDSLLAILQGKAGGLNAEVMQALGAPPLPIPQGCAPLGESLVAGMPRMVVGVSEAEASQIAVRSIWESTPGVADYLQKLAAPVPGVGGSHDGLLAVGMGIDLPQLRNAIEALLRQVMAAGDTCEWVQPDKLQAVIPQLNLALGPMTAGIKGFNLRIEDLRLDSETLEPVDVRAGVLAAVDDPRGVFALGAMFNPALAALEIPTDGTLVELSPELGMDVAMPPLQVAIKDKALLLLAGEESASMAQPLLDAAVLEPAPILAFDYGVHKLMERFGTFGDQAIERLRAQGQTEMAEELNDQLAVFRSQSKLFDHLSMSMYADDKGLIMDQVMTLR